MTVPYAFLPEFTPLSEFSAWEGNLGDFTHVFGHSYLGHLFLWSPAGHYGIAYPYLCRFKDYGHYETPTDFQQAVLQDPYVSSAIFRSDQIPALSARLGAPAPGQVYFPVPYEILGGSGDLETYDRGDLRVWASIVAQTHGLAAHPAT